MKGVLLSGEERGTAVDCEPLAAKQLESALIRRFLTESRVAATEKSLSVSRQVAVTQDLSVGEDAPFADRLQGSRTAQYPGRKHHDAAYHPEHSVDRNPRDAERNQKDPHERVRDQRE